MIHVERCQFEEEEIRSLFVGAGVIPVCEKQGEIYLLLGRERYVSSWKGALKWSGFEGGRKGQEGLEEAAAREYFEESLSCAEGKEVTYDGMVSDLREKRYVSRVVINIYDSSPGKKFHVTYFVRRPSLSLIEEEEEFQRRRSFLLRSSHETSEQASTMGETKEEVHHHNLPSQCWKNGKLNHDCLEKSEVRWWPVSELRRVCDQKGVLREESFRTYFMPVLFSFLHMVDTAPPGPSNMTLYPQHGTGFVQTKKDPIVLRSGTKLLAYPPGLKKKECDVGKSEVDPSAPSDPKTSDPQEEDNIWKRCGGSLHLFS